MALNEGDLCIFVIVAIAVSRGHKIVIWALGDLVSNRRLQRPGDLQLPLADFIAAFRQAKSLGKPAGGQKRQSCEHRMLQSDGTHLMIMTGTDRKADISPSSDVMYCLVVEFLVRAAMSKQAQPVVNRNCPT